MVLRRRQPKRVCSYSTERAPSWKLEPLVSGNEETSTLEPRDQGSFEYGLGPVWKQGDQGVSEDPTRPVLCIPADLRTMTLHTRVQPHALQRAPALATHRIFTLRGITSPRGPDLGQSASERLFHGAINRSVLRSLSNTKNAAWSDDDYPRMSTLSNCRELE